MTGQPGRMPPYVHHLEVSFKGLLPERRLLEPIPGPNA